MNLQEIWCGMIVFVSYLLEGYYKPWEIRRALRDYVAEKRRLSAAVLTVERRLLGLEITVGTLMCSVVKDFTPIDASFPDKVQLLRNLYGDRLAYFGKFGVLHPWRGQAGHDLLREAVTSWSDQHHIAVVVMVVHPRHVEMYRKLGAKVMGHKASHDGLEKAPAVLMVLDYAESLRLQRLRARIGQTQPAAL